jgi:NDP-sugar pyrophosphorylase family protein
MHNSPTLLVLAAGMATRYGSLKQTDSFGPNGETIIDYSVHDAFKAGFGKVVFVIREAIEEEFKAAMRRRFPDNLPIEFMAQELDMLPVGHMISENRTKPWGTGHAVWVAASKIKEPFSVINGDDFYGYQSFKLVADFLKGSTDDTEHGLVGFKLENTLSEHGAVSRGICQLDQYGCLKSVTELTHIVRTEDGIAVQDPGTEARLLDGNEIVSMNLMAFKPSVFPHFEQEFRVFLNNNSANPKAEFYLPAVVDSMVRSGAARVKVLQTPEKWFGVTYPEDKAVAVQSIARLIREGVYHENLWETLSL